MTSFATESAADLKLYELLEEFISMLRRGQGVSVREFAKRHPQYATAINADFPALLMAEGLKPKMSVAPGVSVPEAPSTIPELLGGYRVLRQLGQGGMGVVYEAEHPRLSRRLALKVLIGRKRDSRITERFRREAEAASTLSHPNIVPVYDFGDHKGVHYLAMQMISGQSLDRLLDDFRSQNRLEAVTETLGSKHTLDTNCLAPVSGPKEVHAPVGLIGPNADFLQLAKLGADVASALEHAHENRTIHRDIKPGNLILDQSGKIWVTDFGLAKIHDDGSDLSRTGDVIGTPRFMAPEQMRGLCDQRSDIYSLGVTLYEMASGTRAWDSLNPGQLLQMRATTELPELEVIAPFVPPSLAQIIMKACSSRPEDRHQSAKELQVVLNRFAHGERVCDRRRRPRDSTSRLHRPSLIMGTTVGFLSLAFAAMYSFSIGPFASSEMATTEALMAMVEDESQREKVVENLPGIIESAITSKDPKVRDNAAKLTLQVVEEAMKKTSASREEVDTLMRRLSRHTEEFKKNGALFVYDKTDHPLLNSIRNLNLVLQLNELTILPSDKIRCQAMLATIGEFIKKDWVPAEDIAKLLSFLPEAARTQPVEVILEKSALIGFMQELDRVLMRASSNGERQQRNLLQQLDTRMPKDGRPLKIGEEEIKKLREFAQSPELKKKMEKWKQSRD